MPYLGVAEVQTTIPPQSPFAPCLQPHFSGAAMRMRSMVLWVVSVMSTAIMVGGVWNFEVGSLNSPVIPTYPVLSQHQLPLTSTGTTIVGICCTDGVVLGADTRSTGGPVVIDKNKLKVQSISPHISCCGAGTSADCDQLARRASRDLLLQSIDDDVASFKRRLPPVCSAATSLTRSLASASQGGRRASAVFIIGGVDDSGPRLYQISDQRTHQRVSFGALGSGSTDALAVLEAFARTRKMTQIESSLDTAAFAWQLNVTTDEAIDTVRNAVRAGILNDLGSGSHVDICVITAAGKRQWREEWKSGWKADRPLGFSMDSPAPDLQSSLQTPALLGNLIWSKDQYSKLGDFIDVELL